MYYLNVWLKDRVQDENASQNTSNNNVVGTKSW